MEYKFSVGLTLDVGERPLVVLAGSYDQEAYAVNCTESLLPAFNMNVTHVKVHNDDRFWDVDEGVVAEWQRDRETRLWVRVK